MNELHIINRKTESILDVLGSIGGLYDAQIVVGKLLVGSYN